MPDIVAKHTENVTSEGKNLIIKKEIQPKFGPKQKKRPFSSVVNQQTAGQFSDYKRIKLGSSESVSGLLLKRDEEKSDNF